MDKYKELAIKLNELAKQGIGGEKINAQKMLEKIMKKYNISIEELEEEQEDFFYFNVPKRYEQLFIQILASLDLGLGFLRRGLRVEKLCTKIQKIELEARFGFYLNIYKKEEKALEIAFYHKYNLFSPHARPQERKELTKEEEEQVEKARKYLKNMDIHSYHKQISE